MSEFFCNLKNFISDNLKFVVILCIIIVLAIVLPIALIKVPNENKYDAICKDRSEKCLVSFSLIPSIVQSPIPVFYNNEYYNDTNFPYALRDFFYASSYKSYLPCGYNNDIVSYNALTNVIVKGARVINLDLFWDGDYEFAPNTKIIVGNVKETTFINRENKPVTKKILQTLINDCDKNYKDNKLLKYLEFAGCLEIIKNYGWLNTNAPLFLYLNLEFGPNQGLEYQIYSQIMNYLSIRLIDKYYGFQRVKIGAMPFYRAQNKLIILTNRKPIDTSLDEITNALISPMSTGIKLYEIDVAANVSTYEDKTGPILLGTQMGQDNLKNIENTSQNLVAVISKISGKSDNNYNPKIDTVNYDTDKNFELGISMTFMNWQMYDSEYDKNYLKKYINRFLNGGMILKPIGLRFIPKPKEPIYQRNKKTDFIPMSTYGLNGFMNIKI